MVVMDEIINDKPRKMVWKTRSTGVIMVEYTPYDKCKIPTIWSKPGARDDQIGRVTERCVKSGKKHYFFVGDEHIWEKIPRLWRTEQIGVDRIFRDTERQQDVTAAYHQG